MPDLTVFISASQFRDSDQEHKLVRRCRRGRKSKRNISTEECGSKMVNKISNGVYHRMTSYLMVGGDHRLIAISPTTSDPVASLV